MTHICDTTNRRFSTVHSRASHLYASGSVPAHMSDDDKAGENDQERGVATKTRPKTKKPAMYRVLLMNDDYTTMEFVVSILVTIFQKSAEEATQIMLAVHQNGIGVCGVYTFEIAETKVAQVMDAAKRNQHPLQCTLEKA